MKKIFIALGILVGLGGVGYLVLGMLRKPIIEPPIKKPELATKKETLDLAAFSKFEKSYFGFMHPQKSYSFVKELNVHWQRPHPGPFIWNEIEEREGVYDFSDADEYVKKSQNYDVAIMATIWPYADWDQKTCHSKLPNSPRRDFPMLGDYRGKPCNTISYQNFVKKLVERFDGDGKDDMEGLKYPIKYWEVINEPEMAGDLLFFKGENQAEDYLEVLKNTSQAIKEVDPEAKVLNGGIAALTEKEKPFWQKVLGGEGKNYVDIITIHSIGGSEDLNLNALKTFMQKNGLTQPVWVTEIQFGGPEESPQKPAKETLIDRALAQNLPKMAPKPPEQQKRTEEEWASYLVKVFVRAFGNGAGRLFYVGLDNMAPAASTSLLVNCTQGKEKDPNAPFDPKSCTLQKPFSAFKTMVEKLDYFDRVEKLTEGQYKFTKQGKTVYCLWGKEKSPSEISGKIKVTDIYGQSKDIEAKDLKLSEEPVFVEEGK